MSETALKSFWERPEGLTGKVILGTSILVILGFLFWLVPAALGGNVIALTTLIVVLGMALFFFLDRKMRIITSMSFQRLSRWITSWFIDVDPMKVIQKQINEMEVNLKQMKRQMAKLRVQNHKLKEQILHNKKKIKDHLEKASKAKKTKEESLIIINTRRAARLRESNDKLSNLLNRMTSINVVLKKMEGSSIILLTDVKDQIEIKGKEREAILAGNSAMKSAMTILSGESNQKEQFDEALEEVAQDMTRKVGEMEKFVVISQSFMRSIDLKNGVFEEDGLNMLKKFEQGNAAYFQENIENLKNEIGKIGDGARQDELDLSESAEKMKNERNLYNTLFDLDNEKSDG